MLTLSAIESAAQRIKGYINQTPVITNNTINSELGGSVFLKCENLQKVGAFKARGATNAVFSLDAPNNGIITHSSGNHAQAIAYAAKLRKVPAYIVMPKTTPLVKVDAVRGYGGEIIFCEPNEKARSEAAKELEEKSGGVFIHPFNNYEVMAGQGTCALEFITQCSDLDRVLIPLGGGGLISGCSTVFKALSPKTEVIGVEPEGANDCEISLKNGRRTAVPSPKSIAEGLLTTVGELTFPIIQKQVDRIISVCEDEIVHAVKFLLERTKMVVETSGAVTVAALLSGRVPAKGRTGVILSGGNLDFRAYRDILWS